MRNAARNATRVARGRFGSAAAQPLSVILFSSLGLIAGDPFIIAPNTTVVIDMNTPVLGKIDISGILRFDGGTRTLSGTWIEIQSTGGLEGYQDLTPYPVAGVATINLTGAYVPLTMTTVNGFASPSNAGTSRAIMVQPGGRLWLVGTPPAVKWTTLNAHAAAAATSLTLAVSTGWKQDDPVVVAATDFSNIGVAEQFTLAADASGTSITLNAGLATSRWGLMQYPIDTAVNGSGMSLTQGTFSAAKASANVPTSLDERARVVHLGRNIVVTCPADSDWTTKGHGVHIMGMASGTVLADMRVDGVQILRGGQRGALGRYPLHFHMMSYTAATGAYTVDSTSYFRNCVVFGSENRAYTIHGTCGVDVSDNVSFDVKGHAYFMEDGSERRNTMYRNQMLKTTAPAFEQAMPGTFVSISGDGTTATVNWTAHGLYSGETITVTGASIAGFNGLRFPATVVTANQFTYLCTGSGAPTGSAFTHGNNRVKIHDSAAAGFWITNMDNKNVDNYASSSTAYDPNVTGDGGSGMWLAVSSACFGASALVAIDPHLIPIDTFSGFVGHSNKGRGLRFAMANTSEAGVVSITTAKFLSNGGTITSTDHRLWKNDQGGYQNVVGVTDYRRWVTADNSGQDFFGSTNNGGTSSDHLLIGYSLNNVNAQSSIIAIPRAGFVGYHGTIRFFDVTAINYPYVAPSYLYIPDIGNAGGVNNGGGDFYDSPGIDLTNGATTNIRMVNSHPGAMIPPIHLDNRAVDDATYKRHYSIAGVRQDTDGKYGPAGGFMLAISPATEIGRASCRERV